MRCSFEVKQVTNFNKKLDQEMR